jgi:demethoxyubiquinone hydroxylase (CLK1/Coq7/Cat5 family)
MENTELYNIILDKLSKIENRLTKIETFGRSAAFFIGALAMLAYYGYSLDKKNSVDNDIKHDSQMAAIQNDNRNIVERLLKLEFGKNKK